MSNREREPINTMDTIISKYMENLITNPDLECEVRFGTAKNMKPISKIQQNNIVKRLLSSNFLIIKSQNMLRINSEYTDDRTGETKLSNIRAEINGLSNISQYCKTNSIEDKNGKLMCEFVRKSFFKDGDEPVYPVNMNDFNFRVSLNSEKSLSVNSGIVSNIVREWNNNKKTFRLINRSTLYNELYPVRVDVSVVKSSGYINNKPILSYKFEESNVMKSMERYEVEIELLNNKIGSGTEFDTVEKTLFALKKVIRFVLSGIQGSNFPISFREQSAVLDDYMSLIFRDKYNRDLQIKPKNFIGPSSLTLQMQNIIERDGDSDDNIPNIRKDYCVTDKADGDRKLLFINRRGSIYLIDTNMNVQFTGSMTRDKRIFDTLIDGEHILHNKNRDYINLFAAFDIYYYNGRDVRDYGFINYSKEDPRKFRLPILRSVAKNIKPIGVNKTILPIRIESKSFYVSTKRNSIFARCGYILSRVNDGVYEYNTDGLIFTPTRFGVGGDRIGKASPPFKTTWKHSFKWKPPQFNTIDFLISTKKNSDGKEFVGNMFQSGKDMEDATELSQYKTLVLRVGFDESVHGYINPCNNILEEDFDNEDDTSRYNRRSNYKPLQFFPTNPTDNKAGICNIMLENDSNGDLVMFTEEREIIEDNMIVEFKYDMDRKDMWKWIPLRVRYDKTAEFRAGGKNYGNAYHVANNNWHTIHNPVTSKIISTGEGIPLDSGDDDIYYNRVSNKSTTRGLRDFHNLFVKKNLIESVSKPDDTLIDLAVGKGGDISKWIKSKLKFVYGIDISKDNIENRLDGACARYLNYHKKFKNIPYAIFLNGNSTVNIRNGDALYTDKAKMITKAIFGEGAKEEDKLGKGVYKRFGIASKGFNICSIQFAIHYMFENQLTFNNFLRNVSETTEVGGYFIGTCYDGKKIFNLMKNKKQNESYIINDDTGEKMWEITKDYDSDEFKNDVSSLGYAINVYQESINKVFKEYLVNFEYLDSVIQNYGFRRLTRDEAKDLNFPSSVGSFKELYGMMTQEIERNPEIGNNYGNSINMTEGEKLISFLNNYFIYKKVYDVDANTVSKEIIGRSEEEVLDEEDETKKAQKAVENVIASTRPSRPTRKIKLSGKAKKLSKKLRLQQKEK